MNHSPYPVILDACVLYPSLLRDLLIRLGIAGLYQPQWTATIHNEWQRNLLKNRPDLTSKQIEYIATLMDKAIPSAMINGYEELIDGLVLPDLNDRHVLAAAIRCNAETIVTFNLKDFPKEKLIKFNIEALHPDEFISDLLDLNHALVLSVIYNQRKNMKKPAMNIQQYFESLLRQSLPMTVKSLEKYTAII
ncbi:PIN domain-containing protein [Proteus sp. GOKU]|uniref:PIN domain-containing protein n=1 Tax=Proteus TaxID=583 RepID=UPI001892891D|nr:MULTISPECIES: PIN domain-containing protein [Proteus]QPB78960.1 PIN domain-containing protein [Proteus sp. GOKU]QQP24967.1 PIN domain-containing protein [Proteus vulgaris]